MRASACASFSKTQPQRQVLNSCHWPVATIRLIDAQWLRPARARALAHGNRFASRANFVVCSQCQVALPATRALSPNTPTQWPARHAKARITQTCCRLLVRERRSSAQQIFARCNLERARARASVSGAKRAKPQARCSCVCVCVRSLALRRAPSTKRDENEKQQRQIIATNKLEDEQRIGLPVVKKFSRARDFAGARAALLCERSLLPLKQTAPRATQADLTNCSCVQRPLHKAKIGFSCFLLLHCQIQMRLWRRQLE